MRGVHRLNEWKSAFIKPLQVVSEKISFTLLRNSKNYFSIDLNSKEILSNSFIQFKSYENYEQNLEVQRIKTERRLRVFKEESKSIMWTKEINIKDISNLIKDHGQGAIISGLCMGSRSGEEQTLFHKFLGKNSKVFGVELHSDAKSLPNTIIADFRFMLKNCLKSFILFISSDTTNFSSRY